MEHHMAKETKIERTSSSDSKSSPESKVTSQTKVSLRKGQSDADTTSSSIKPDRKSVVEFESSSGESHYQSFEIDSGKSRPCSSDIEALIAPGSSEYESALTSQEYSIKSPITSTEYQTAATSLSSKESMKSLDSESSGNLASIEVSEVSETLVPSDSDADLIEQEHILVTSSQIDDTKVFSSNFDESLDLLEDEMDPDAEKHSKMKRSHEMTFQPESIISLSESPQEEKLGTSLDEGSLVSASSTSSLTKTVIERFDPECSSLTLSGTSDLFTIDPILTTEMSTSTAQIMHDTQIESITFTTSQADGIRSVNTQVTSGIQQQLSKQITDDPKKKSHRRQESQIFVSAFVPSTKLDDKNDFTFNENSYKERKNVDEIENETKSKIQRFIEMEKTSSIHQDKKSVQAADKHIIEAAEAGIVFSMVAHTSPAHKIAGICPIPEDADAEKNELDSKKPKLVTMSSPLKDIPNINITQHMAPLVDNDFYYPDLELERKEKEKEDQKKQSAPQTPGSNSSSKSSEDTDQGREYVLEDSEISYPSSAKQDSRSEMTTTSITTVIEETLKGEGDKDTDSPNSDSFELIEKPDLIDDFIVIEEVAKEASEMDSEGKSVIIQDKVQKRRKKNADEDIILAKSDPTPLTKVAEMKYYPEGSEELGFDFEDSPPQAQKGTTTSKDSMYEYDRELEANKKWIEQQFQGDQAAMTAAGYNYDMEFERGPLEDIKEEDINDFDPSSRIGSVGSQKESGTSGGSLGSIKDSYSSTPEYDVLAGRKYFTRSGEHDDMSMSSLQEFENLEKAMSLENRRFHQGSQDSSSNGSFKGRYVSTRNAQGDDVSVSSLKEFEGLEMACIAAHKIETKVKEEEAMLAQIDEGQESLVSESDSLKTVSTVSKKLDSDDDDYEKRMFEIDEIIKQAQTNVERFIDLKEGDKTESLGRGDSLEEVARVPDLDLDQPIIKSTIKVQWKENEDVMITSTDSLELKPEGKSHHDSTDSLDQKTGAEIMTTSTDSIEEKKCKDEQSHIILSDSLEFGVAPADTYIIHEISKSHHDHSSSSTGKDFSSSTKDEIADQEVIADYMVESIESLDPTSSTATHATYQNDTDSVFSGSFTSGGSNTMVSSTDTMDPAQKEAIDLGEAAKKVWFEQHLEDFEDTTKPYVTEVIEPCEDGSYSHTIHRRVEFPVKVTKLTFTGSDAEDQLQKFMQGFDEGENVEEKEEIDSDGNIHVTRVLQKRVIVKSGESGQEQDKLIKEQFKQFCEQDKAEAKSKLTTLTKKIPEEETQTEDLSLSKDEGDATNKHGEKERCEQ